MSFPLRSACIQMRMNSCIRASRTLPRPTPDDAYGVFVRKEWQRDGLEGTWCSSSRRMTGARRFPPIEAASMTPLVMPPKPLTVFVIPV